MMTIFSLLDALCFTAFMLFTIYLFVFSLYSLRNRKNPYPETDKRHKFIVLFPAYKEDAVIEQSVRDFISQDYPKDRYDIVVISDKMKDTTVELLRSLPVRVIVADFVNSSKAAALNLAMNSFEDNDYEAVVIMDADNRVESDFLHSLNKVYDFGIQAIQTRRVAKNKNTDVALLDAASEEINNSIFRKGHVNAGLSSALSGSGMAFDFKWFKKNIAKIHTVGEDKEIELLLLHDKVYIEYLDDVLVKDEKVQKTEAFSRQRQRWLFAQYNALKIGLKKLPEAIVSGNIDYCDKLFQWILPPRVVMAGIMPIIILVTLLVEWQASLKWVVLYFVFLSSLSLALPDELYDKPLKKALNKIPMLFIKMMLGFFGFKKSNNEFIHTQHGEEE